VFQDEAFWIDVDVGSTQIGDGARLASPCPRALLRVRTGRQRHRTQRTCLRSAFLLAEPRSCASYTIGGLVPRRGYRSPTLFRRTRTPMPAASVECKRSAPDTSRRRAAPRGRRVAARSPGTERSDQRPRQFQLQIVSQNSVSSLFHPAFAVFFSFPSRYLFAIGLQLIFSFSRQIPANLRSIPKLRDSTLTRALTPPLALA